MKKIIFCFLLIFTDFYIHAASPRNAKELVQPGSWIYDSLSLIATENGKVDFSDDAPLTVSQIRILLKSYDYDSLNENSKHHYDKILSYFDQQDISFHSGVFSLGVAPEINLEGTYKFNNQLDWDYDRYRRHKFLLIPATFNIGDYLTMQTNLSLAQNKGWSSHNDNYVNFPFPVESMDINFPSSGYVSTGFDLPKDCQVNFRLGLGEQSIGRSLNGSVIFSEYMTGSSWANLEFFSKNLKYNLNITQFNVDKYMYTHRIDVRFFDKLHISGMESILVYAPFELRFLNPWTIYHGMTPWLDYTGEPYKESNTCAYLCIKAAYSPVKNLRIYALFAQDQFQTKFELENWPNDVTPNGIGFQFGVESFIPFADGNFHIWGEAYYADPFLYIKEDPNWTMIRTYRENFGDLATFYEWVGSPFGPDTIAGELNFSYEADRWQVGLDYLFKAAGEYSGTRVFTKDLSWGGHDTNAAKEHWVYPDSKSQGQDEAKRRQALTSPSGTPEYLNRIALRGAYTFNDFLSINGQAAFVFAFNHNNVINNFQCGPEFALNLRFDATKLYRNLMDNRGTK